MKNGKELESNLHNLYTVFTKHNSQMWNSVPCKCPFPDTCRQSAKKRFQRFDTVSLVHSDFFSPHHAPIYVLYRDVAAADIFASRLRDTVEHIPGCTVSTLQQT